MCVSFSSFFSCPGNTDYGKVTSAQFKKYNAKQYSRLFSPLSCVLATLTVARLLVRSARNTVLSNILVSMLLLCPGNTSRCKITSVQRKEYNAKPYFSLFSPLSGVPAKLAAATLLVRCYCCVEAFFGNHLFLFKATRIALQELAMILNSRSVSGTPNFSLQSC